jgi:hypothetical protein
LLREFENGQSVHVVRIVERYCFKKCQTAFVLVQSLWWSNQKLFAPPMDEGLLNRIIQLTESDQNFPPILNRDLGPVL